MNWLADADPSPKILVLPPAAVDLAEADAAIELWEHYSRKTLDDSQRLTVQVMMALGADAKWAASTTGREMSRQNGKGDEIEVVELWGLLQRGEAILHTLHDAVLLATQTQQRMLGVLEGHPDLRRKVKRKWQGTGQQMIEMRNGGIIWYRTRTGGGGRGLDYIDRLVVDEAQHATEEHIAAVSPALLANPNSQLNAMGTAGIAGTSRWWWSVRIRALSGDPGAFGYVGHTAETVYLNDEGSVVQEPVDPSDRSKWPPANPAVMSGRGGGMAFLEEQFRRLGATFAREHLGVWDPPDDVVEASSTWTTITRSDWDHCGTDYDLDEAGFLTGPITLAIEMDAGSRLTHLVAAGAHGEVVGVDLHATFPNPREVVPYLLQLKATAEIAVVLDKRGPASSLLNELTEAGIEVEEIDTPTLMRGTGAFIDAATDQQVRHRHREALDESIGRATLRKYGESRLINRAGDGDPSVAIGAVLAHLAHVAASTKPPGFAMILGGS